MIQEKYAPHDIEAKWQKYWEENKTFKVEMDKDKPKSYVLENVPLSVRQPAHGSRS